ncbi:MAG: hypothetical protein R8M46_04070 [Ghiorsea sp.]
MTKYIDLLRAHQQQKADGEKLPATDHVIDEHISEHAAHIAEESYNPYSKKITSSTASPDSTPDLIEESSLPVSQESKPVIEHDLLLAEEETTSTETTPHKQNPEEQPKNQADIITSTSTSEPRPANKGNTQNFDVATWLCNINQTMGIIFQAAQQGKPADFTMLNEHLGALLSHIESNSKTLDALELEISRTLKDMCHTETGVNDLVEKSIMMMLYTIKICIQLQLQHDEIIHHTVAAMLHHIGMTMVSDEVRHKTTKLSKDEIKLIRKAPQNAVAYLQTCQLDHENILLAASQSSERYDGSGASGLSGHSIAWIARVVGLLSMFEALIHFRPYRQRLLPRDAIRELVNKHKKAFDPVMLKALIESVSLYPVGTFVQLNTGEIGQVIIVHNKFPLRPVVHINMDKHGNAITEREIDLKQQPNLMIQKCMYEEALTNIKEDSL